MPTSARFAAISLSVSLSALVFATTAASAADVRRIEDATKIAAVFPAAAKVRVINIWATWCAPCVEEMPDLRALDEAFGSDVAIIGVSLDDVIPGAQPAKVTSFLDKQKIAFPNIYYTGNSDDLGKALGFNGELPVTIVYDRKGKELWRHQGRLDREETIARVRELSRRMK